MKEKRIDQVAAGYILYGSSTMLVYTTGHGVNGFTYEQGSGEYFLSQSNMQIPEDGRIYSVNEGFSSSFSPSVKAYLPHCKNENYTARCIGPLVADFHRNLLKGGIYIYPATEKDPEGNLRLIYERNALAFLVEEAGGKATDATAESSTSSPPSVHPLLRRLQNHGHQSRSQLSSRPNAEAT